MSATCKFCGQQFGNAQGVRAHLKACGSYRERPAKSLRQKLATRQGGLGSEPQGTDSLGSEPRQNETNFDPVRQLQQRLTAERLRLQLREVEDAHAEMDKRGAAKQRERIEAQEREFAPSRSGSKDEGRRATACRRCGGSGPSAARRLNGSARSGGAQTFRRSSAARLRPGCRALSWNLMSRPEC